MIIGAAVCPSPPLLAREVTGQSEVLPELRAACAAAVTWLAALEPDLLVITGPDEETAGWPANGTLDLAAYAPALARSAGAAMPGYEPSGNGLAGSGLFGADPPGFGPARPFVPLSLGIGARLLDDAGYSGPRALHAIAARARWDDCLTLGTRIAARAPRVALLAMGDGTARRSTSAPGYLDERAEPFDAAVEHAFRDGDLPALAALDPALAADLLAAGRPAWQVLAGALMAGPIPASARHPSAGRDGSAGSAGRDGSVGPDGRDGSAGRDGGPGDGVRPAGPASSGGSAGHDESGKPAYGIPVTRVLYADAPLGVAYLVATLTPAPPQ